jgi:hypothetical protein
VGRVRQFLTVVLVGNIRKSLQTRSYLGQSWAADDSLTQVQPPPGMGKFQGGLSSHSGGRGKECGRRWNSCEVHSAHSLF